MADKVPHSLTSEPFRLATARRVAQYLAHYGDRLVAVSVFGSVHRGEADPHASDLDLVLVTTDGFGQADQEWEIARWREQERRRDQERSSSLCGGGEIDGEPTRAISVEMLQRGLLPDVRQRALEERAVRLAVDGAALSAEEGAALRSARSARTLHYDSTLVFGTDLVRAAPPPPLDGAWAALYLQGPAAMVDQAVSGDGRGERSAPAPLPPLPSDPPQRLRKLARLAVLGGACLLMARGQFTSYRGADVLHVLKGLYPEWAAFLAETQASFSCLREATPETASAYLSDLVRWMDWARGMLRQG